MNTANTRLPVVQSIPHGGMDAPEEFAERLVLGERGIYNEADLWADALYDFSLVAAPRKTLATVRAAIARGIVDVNRPPDDLANPDGAVKAVSSYGAETFAPPLDEGEKRTLVGRYWQPWHAELSSALAENRDRCRLLLDCHTMAQRGPTTYAYAGAARPFICIANLGDADGEPRSSGMLAGRVTAPGWFLRKCGEIAQGLFADMTLLEPDGGTPPVVALNWPFPGGYIIKRYTGLAQDRTDGQQPLAPWSLMVEINRGLYVGNQSGETLPAPPNEARIAEVRERLAAWTEAICALLPEAGQ